MQFFDSAHAKIRGPFEAISVGLNEKLRVQCKKLRINLLPGDNLPKARMRGLKLIANNMKGGVAAAVSALDTLFMPA